MNVANPYDSVLSEGQLSARDHQDQNVYRPGATTFQLTTSLEKVALGPYTSSTILQIIAPNSCKVSWLVHSRRGKIVRFMNSCQTKASIASYLVRIPIKITIFR
ncbi:hypothetical protein CUMW_146090 [Citrus unshiu]|nr:hypothetical protein CUMW_146090 [Citrus unshiu]